MADGGRAMEFDTGRFLAEYAAAYNARDPRRLCELFALDDPRFSVFEEFSGELIGGSVYGGMLDSVADACGEMSFELLSSHRFGEFRLVYAIQRVAPRKGDPGAGEGSIRATLWISLAGTRPKIVSAHFSSMMLCFPKRATVLPVRKSG
jgi:hypothetical protein